MTQNKKAHQNYFKYILFLFLCSCVTTKQLSRSQNKAAFDKIQKTHSVWNERIGDSLKKALADFKSKKLLPNSKIYGAIAQKTPFHEFESLKNIQALEKEKECRVIKDYIRNYKTNEFVKYKNRKLPMLVIDCQDGSLIRLKPYGNPLSKHRSWAHGSKSVKFPYDSDYKNFSNESFKVDNDGNAVPKWPKDLRKGVNPEAWAEDAHHDIQKIPSPEYILHYYPF